MNNTHKLKIIAVLPAFNASKTIDKFLNSLPIKFFSEVILIDDCSFDNTFKLAEKHKDITVLKNPTNLGYGGNLKRCLSMALDKGADIIVELHPDGEYGFDGIEASVEEINKGAKLVLGNRFSTKERRGMYLHKYIFIRLLTFLDNMILGTNIPDIHQGFRVYTKDFLTKVNFKANSNDYIFSFEIITQAVFKQIKISSVPVSTNYSGKKRGASLRSSIIYSLKTFWVLLLLWFAKIGVKNKIFNFQLI